MLAQRFNSIINFSDPGAVTGIKIISPASGRVEAISSDDPNSIGEGIKIILESQKIISPINGRIMAVTPSHGQIIVQAKNKLRFQLQLPFDYSNFHGLGIRLNVKEGQAVNKGDRLMELDLYKIKFNLQPVPLYITLLTPDAFGRIDVPHRHVQFGQDTIFSLVPTQTKK